MTTLHTRQLTTIHTRQLTTHKTTHNNTHKTTHNNTHKTTHNSTHKTTHNNTHKATHNNTHKTTHNNTHKTTTTIHTGQLTTIHTRHPSPSRAKFKNEWNHTSASLFSYGDNFTFLPHNTFQPFFFSHFVQTFLPSYVCRLLIVCNNWIFSSFYDVLVVTSPAPFPCRQKKVSHCRLVHLLECTGDALPWEDGVFPSYCIATLLCRQRNQWRKKKIDAIYVRMGHKNEPIFPLGRQNRERQLHVLPFLPSFFKLHVVNN